VIEARFKTHFALGRRGRRQLHHGCRTTAQSVPSRLTMLMALAIRFETMLKTGEAASCSELAELAGVDRGQISKVMKLRLLAPEIQSTLLAGSKGLELKQVLPLARLADWKQQRAAFAKLART